MTEERMIGFDALRAAFHHCRGCCFNNGKYCFVEDDSNCPIWQSLGVPRSEDDIIGEFIHNENHGGEYPPQVPDER